VTDLSWPFFEARHRELAENLQQWCSANCEDRYADDLDSECRALVRELGASGFLKLCVADAKRRPDVRSLAIARETLAYHSALADFASPCKGWVPVRFPCSAPSNRSAAGFPKWPAGRRSPLSP
jgi:acyl-CoA dehydrogenase